MWWSTGLSEVRPLLFVFCLGIQWIASTVTVQTGLLTATVVLVDMIFYLRFVRPLCIVPGYCWTIYVFISRTMASKLSNVFGSIFSELNRFFCSHMGFNTVVCKLYSNSLMSSLNSRGGGYMSTTQSLPTINSIFQRPEETVEHGGSNDSVSQVPESKVGEPPQGFQRPHNWPYRGTSRSTAPVPYIGENKKNLGSLSLCTVNLAECKDERITTKRGEELVFSQTEGLSTLFGRTIADSLLNVLNCHFWCSCKWKYSLVLTFLCFWNSRDVRNLRRGQVVVQIKSGLYVKVLKLPNAHVYLLLLEGLPRNENQDL